MELPAHGIYIRMVMLVVLCVFISYPVPFCPGLRFGRQGLNTVIVLDIFYFSPFQFPCHKCTHLDSRVLHLNS